MTLPAALDRRFEAAVFDWDGTAVRDRRADASPLRQSVEELCSDGFDVAVVSGTHVENVDGQLGARPGGPGRLHLLLNRGSEVFRVTTAGPELVYRREATTAEDEALTEAAEGAVLLLAERGLRTELVSQRLNRRKIDLIPEPEWADPPKARIGELLQAVEERLRGAGITGLAEAAALALSAASQAGLPAARVTSDAKHVEIGLTDKADSARWILRDLWRRGVGPGLVLIAGDELGPLGGLPGSDSLLLVPQAARATAISVGREPTGVPAGVLHVGGGPEAFLAVLEDQRRRRLARELPELDGDPLWTLTVEGFDQELERVHETLLTLSDGRIGTSGSPLAGHPAATPDVLAAGVYVGEGEESELAPLPVWAGLGLELAPGASLRRLLDLRIGLLREELGQAGETLSSVRFSSLARPGTASLRVVGDPAALTSESAGTPSGESPAAATAEELIEHDRRATLDRLAVYRPEAGSTGSPEPARQALGQARAAGFERLLVEHRTAWAGRWEDADVTIEGDPELQLAVRFALFHLMAAVGDLEEAAVGARGLSGRGYRGHVFWDADVFTLPFLAATHPEAARAMLEYRLRRLPAACSAAGALGREGARFPWESAASGFDVTPRSGRERTGRVVAILTGEQEEHIVADVAWAAGCYLDWTGDREFARGPARALLIETARYWASRIRIDSDGRGHIDGVIGPDEYHESVADNAFTNVMARWNLRRAAEAAGSAPEGLRGGEREAWLAAAASLVDNYNPRTRLYEQFAGFFDLEPLIIADVAPRRPIAAPALLGWERVRAAQVVKQADVLMLHHLVPAEVEPGSLEPNLAYYEPRTAHGSSLSPGVHASLFARAGRLEEAVRALKLAGRIDLDDLTGTTAAGLHLGAMGSIWQALVFGFLGLRPSGETLEVDPRLPEQWSSLEARVRFRGSRVRVRVEGDGIAIEADPPATVAVVGAGAPAEVGPAGIRVSRRS